MYCWFKIFEMQLELVCTQGDSGGPLTVVLKGKHVLVHVRKRSLLPKVPNFETKKMALLVAKSIF